MRPCPIRLSRFLAQAYLGATLRPAIFDHDKYGSVPSGTNAVSEGNLRRRTASQRSSSGISRSIRITSGCSVAANLQPVSLSSAARTSKSPRSRTTQARALLTEVYGRTEGFATRDLVEAKTLLDALY